jgi:hypothetical protein
MKQGVGCCKLHSISIVTLSASCVSYVGCVWVNQLRQVPVDLVVAVCRLGAQLLEAVQYRSVLLSVQLDSCGCG